jgi:hypothetical protein
MLKNEFKTRPMWHNLRYHITKKTVIFILIAVTHWTSQIHKTHSRFLTSAAHGKPKQRKNSSRINELSKTKQRCFRLLQRNHTTSPLLPDVVPTFWDQPMVSSWRLETWEKGPYIVSKRRALVTDAVPQPKERRPSSKQRSSYSVTESWSAAVSWIEYSSSWYIRTVKHLPQETWNKKPYKPPPITRHWRTVAKIQLRKTFKQTRDLQLISITRKSQGKEFD